MGTSLPRINELLFLKILKSIQLNLKNCLLITSQRVLMGTSLPRINELLFLKILKSIQFNLKNCLPAGRQADH